MSINRYRSEVWKKIRFDTPLPHARYEVSSHGRIRSFAVDKINGRVMKGSNVNGYLSVMVRLGKKVSQTHYIHRLVAGAFLEQPSIEYKYVVHLDYNKQNNSRYNLRWMTERELNEHNNHNPAILRSRTTGYKLTETDVRVIKRLLKSNKTRLSMIAKRFNITHTQLNRIRSGENWGNVTI
ncbi:NUMOD4 domain-containing protein [Tunicatimonas pelagia]|uniref:NUMOD4 domain-containing protein n=1 Tax=Tunicatimonas pelagia TaxID=931531 RepID=UPI0026656DB7|nr:NUMOD4 domain-containing protein [Tunicatimonas pelagia]WKN45547.1 NUMOD4 domain-containing protein [Tunicatimonas pelagia]